MKNLAVILLSVLTAIAVRADEYPVPKGTDITVDKYLSETQSFLVTSIKEPSVGPNIVKAADLKKAIGIEGSLEAFLKKKDQWVGSQFNLQLDLPRQPVPLPTPKPAKKK